MGVGVGGGLALGCVWKDGGLSQVLGDEMDGLRSGRHGRADRAGPGSEDVVFLVFRAVEWGSEWETGPSFWGSSLESC